MNDPLTEQVLAASFEVANTLGAGFLEKVYQRSLFQELKLRNIKVTSESSLPVTYKGHAVGEYFADLLVEDHLVLELKAVDRLAPEHSAQSLNYLKTCNRSVALLINFGRARIEWKRIVNHHQPLSAFISVK